MVASFHHWSHFTGPYEGRPPTGEKLVMYGVMIATVTKEMKFQDIELYFDPNPILSQLTGRVVCPVTKEIK